MTWGIARYEMKMQLRSLVFWLALGLIGLFFYSELVSEPMGEVQAVHRYQENPEGAKKFWSPEAIEQFASLGANGFDPTTEANRFADRMQIVFAFGLLFTTGFMLERDRLTRSRETLAAHPVSSREYILGKYLGAVVPMLVASAAAVAAVIMVHFYANAQLEQSSQWLPFVRAWGLLLVPTVIYGGAVVMALTALFSRAAAAIPVYLAYEVVGGVAPIAKQILGIWMWVARTETLRYDIWSEGLGTLLINRGLYLALSVVLVAVAMWAYDRRLRRGDVA